MAKLSDDTIRWILDLDAKGVQSELQEISKESENLAAKNKELEAEMKAVKKQMVDAEKEMKKLSDKGKENSEAYREAQARYHSAADELATFTKQVAANKKAIEENKAKVQEMTKTLAVEDMTMNQLKRRASELQKQLNNTAKSTSPESYANLEKELRKVNGRMSELKGTTNGVMFSNYAEKLKSFLGVNDQFANSILNLSKSGNGISKIFSAIVSGAKAAGTALLTLLTNPVFLVIAGIAGTGMALKWWYDYNKGLMEASRLTKAFTDKTGDDMKAYRNQVQAVADVFGADFEETLQSATSMAKTFGISYEDALDKVKDGFIVGANIQGNYQNQLKQFGPIFKNMGVSAEDFIAILASVNKTGLDSDKILNSFKMADNRIRTMSSSVSTALKNIGVDTKQLESDLQSGNKNTYDAIKLVSEKLKELPKDSAASGQAIKAVFGKDGAAVGVELLQNLDQIGGNLDEMKKKAGDLGKVRDEQVAKQAELNNIMSGFFDSTGGGFEMMIAKGKLFTVNTLVGIAKGIISIINYFVKLYNDSILFRAVIQGIITSWNVLWNTVKSVFTYMMDEIKVIGKALHGAFTLNFDEIKQAYAEWGNNTNKLAKNIVNGTVKAVKEGTDNLQKQIKPVTIPIKLSTSSTPNKTYTIKDNVNSGGDVPDKDTKSKTNVSQEKLKTLQGELEKELAVYKTQLAEKKINLQQYNAEEERLTLESFEKQLKVTGLKSYEIAAIQKKMAEYKLKLVEEDKKLEEEKQRISDSIAEKLMSNDERELQSVRAKYNSIRKEMTDFHNKGFSSEQEFQTQMADLQLRESEEIADKKKKQQETAAALVLAQQDEMMLQEQNLEAEKYAAGLLSKEKYEKNLLEIEQKYLEKSIDISNLSDKDKKKAKEKLTKFLIQKNEKEVEAEKVLQETKQQIISNFLSAAASLFSEHTAAYKILATAQATMDTYVAANKVLASDYPFPLNLVAMATVITTGLANVAKITDVFGSSSSSSSSSGGTGSFVTNSSGETSGYADGGYHTTGGFTGSGKKYEVAGFFPDGQPYHAGEYIIPQEVIHIPQVAEMIRNIEPIRQQTVSKSNPLPPGFADGGYHASGNIFSGMDADTINSLKLAIDKLIDNGVSVNYYSFEKVKNKVDKARSYSQKR